MSGLVHTYNYSPHHYNSAVRRAEMRRGTPDRGNSNRRPTSREKVVTAGRFENQRFNIMQDHICDVKQKLQDRVQKIQNNQQRLYDKMGKLGIGENMDESKDFDDISAINIDTSKFNILRTTRSSSKSGEWNFLTEHKERDRRTSLKTSPDLKEIVSKVTKDNQTKFSPPESPREIVFKKKKDPMSICHNTNHTKIYNTQIVQKTPTKQIEQQTGAAVQNVTREVSPKPTNQNQKSITLDNAPPTKIPQLIPPISTAVLRNNRYTAIHTKNSKLNHSCLQKSEIVKIIEEKAKAREESTINDLGRVGGESPERTKEGFGVVVDKNKELGCAEVQPKLSDVTSDGVREMVRIEPKVLVRDTNTVRRFQPLRTFDRSARPVSQQHSTTKRNQDTPSQTRPTSREIFRQTREQANNVKRGCQNLSAKPPLNATPRRYPTFTPIPSERKPRDSVLNHAHFSIKRPNEATPVKTSQASQDKKNDSTKPKVSIGKTNTAHAPILKDMQIFESIERATIAIANSAALRLLSKDLLNDRRKTQHVSCSSLCEPSLDLSANNKQPGRQEDRKACLRDSAKLFIREITQSEPAISPCNEPHVDTQSPEYKSYKPFIASSSSVDKCQDNVGSIQATRLRLEQLSNLCSGITNNKFSGFKTEAGKNDGNQSRGRNTGQNSRKDSANVSHTQSQHNVRDTNEERGKDIEYSEQPQNELRQHKKFTFNSHLHLSSLNSAYMARSALKSSIAAVEEKLKSVERRRHQDAAEQSITPRKNMTLGEKYIQRRTLATGGSRPCLGDNRSEYKTYCSELQNSSNRDAYTPTKASPTSDNTPAPVIKPTLISDNGKKVEECRKLLSEVRQKGIGYDSGTKLGEVGNYLHHEEALQPLIAEPPWRYNLPSYHAIPSSSRYQPSHQHRKSFGQKDQPSATRHSRTHYNEISDKMRSSSQNRYSGHYFGANTNSSASHLDYKRKQFGTNYSYYYQT
jgi:hypothetical protein